jgi:hypothetical protein
MIFGWIPGVGIFFGWGTYGVLHLVMQCVETIANFPGAEATFQGVQGWMLILWYGGWIYFLWRQKYVDDCDTRGASKLRERVGEDES